MLLNHQFSNSSMLSSVTYNTEEKEMSVTFNNGREYVYTDVDKSLYETLIGASSPGSYFNSIKKNLEIKK